MGWGNSERRGQEEVKTGLRIAGRNVPRCYRAMGGLAQHP